MNRSPTSRRKPLAALALIAGALALAPSGGAVGRYSDATGDNAGAPDITGVSVQSDAAGQIVFQISLVDLPSPADVRTLLLLNTDMNLETGEPDTGGADHYFGIDESDNTYWFVRWNGTEWEQTSYTTVRVNSNRTSATISVNRSELGNTEAFTFWVRTRAGAVEANQADDAPEEGSWQYSLAAGGPQIESVLVTTKPGFGPRAGKLFTVTPAGLRLPEVVRSLIAPNPESYSCRARLAGKQLTGAGAQGCSWRLDRKSRGKRLVVELTVVYQGTTATFSLPYRVG
jgi:hypothetical protein